MKICNASGKRGVATQRSMLKFFLHKMRGFFFGHEHKNSMCSTRKIHPRSGVRAPNKGAHFAKNEPLHSPKKKFQSKTRLRKAV